MLQLLVQSASDRLTRDMIQPSTTVSSKWKGKPADLWHFSWWACSTAFLYTSLSVACAQSNGPEPETNATLTVSSGKEISLVYTLRINDREVYDSNVRSEPLTYVQGKGQLVPGLEAALEGMAVGERKRVTVPPAEGYGEINPLHRSEIPKELIPPGARQVGAQLQTKSRHGQPIMMQVKEIKKETIVMDFNHPLAGKTLHFDVKVVDIK